MSRVKSRRPRAPVPSRASAQAAPTTRILEQRITDHSGWVLISLLLLTVFVVFHRFLLFTDVYLYKDIGSDSVNIFYPGIVHLFTYLTRTGIPGWSFNQGMGQNFYPFSFSDPFYVVLTPFAGGRLAYGIAYMEAVKIVAAGTLFYLYLRTLSRSRYAATVGGLLYAFSGYVIVGSCWTVFSTEAVYAALLLYAFERFLKDHIWLFPLPVALITLLQPFYLYLYGLFVLSYGSLRFVEERGWNVSAYLTFLIRLAGVGAVGVALTGVFLFSDILQLLQSPRVGGEASYFKTLSSASMFAFGTPANNVTALLRLFSSDMLGTGSDFKGWHNYLEAPMYYCGLSSLLLAPQAFAYVSPRQKKLYGLLAMAFLIPIVLPYFRYAFWLFSGDYYRTFSLFVALVLLFLAISALSAIDQGASVNRRYLAVSLAVVLLLLFVGATSRSVQVDAELPTTAAVFLVAYAGLIYLMGSARFRPAAKTIFLFLICAELMFLSSITVNKRSVMTSAELQQKVGYNDYSNEAIAYIKSQDKSFYRVDKEYSSGPAIHASINDAQIQDYYGTSSYSQFNQLNYINFLAAMGIVKPSDETSTRWARGLGGRPLLMALASVKYLLTKGSGTNILNAAAYDSAGTFGDVHVFKSNYSLPLGFTYDKYVPGGDFIALKEVQRDVTLLNAFVADASKETDLQGFERLSAVEDADAFGFADFRKGVEARQQESLSISEHSQNLIKGTIAVTGRKMLFFSIPFDKGWSAWVDGKNADLWLVNIGFMGLPLEAGTHNVELRFVPPLRKAGLYVSLSAMALYGALFLASRRGKKASAG